MNVRIIDIAKKAGVSAGTVDRIIHQRGKCSDKAIVKVNQAIEELGYEPDMMARNLALKKVLNIVCLMPNPDETEYWSRPIAGIEQAISELTSFKVKVDIILFSTRASSFSEACDRVLNLQADGVIYVPLFFEESKVFVQKLNQKNIPFVHVNIYQKELNPLCFIGQDALQAGRLAASICKLGIKDIERILIAYISKPKQEYSHIELRIKGFLEFFSENRLPMEQISQLHLKVGENDNEYETVFRDYLTASPNTRFIYVPNSRAYRIANILKKYKINGITIIGFDTLEQNIEFLNKGYIQFLIAQQSKNQGYQAVMTLFNALFRKMEIKNEHYLAIDILNKENIDFYSGRMV